MIFETAVRDIPAVHRNLNKMYKSDLTKPYEREPMHPLLSACHHSREAYLKRYTRWGRYTAPNQDKYSWEFTVTLYSYRYIDFTKDIFQINLTNTPEHDKRKRVTIHSKGRSPFGHSTLDIFVSKERNGVGRIQNAKVTNIGSLGVQYAEMQYSSQGAVSEKEFLAVVLHQINLGRVREYLA